MICPARIIILQKWKAIPSTKEVRRVTLAAFRLPAGKFKPSLSSFSLRQRPPFLDFALSKPNKSQVLKTHTLKKMMRRFDHTEIITLFRRHGVKLQTHRTSFVLPSQNSSQEWSIEALRWREAPLYLSNGHFVFGSRTEKGQTARDRAKQVCGVDHTSATLGEKSM